MPGQAEVTRPLTELSELTFEFYIKRFRSVPFFLSFFPHFLPFVTSKQNDNNSHVYLKLGSITADEQWTFVNFKT